MRTTLISAVVLFIIPTTLMADDWPQWMGPGRQSVWKEEGIVDRFPEDGLKPKWKAPVGLGYSGPAVADGKVFVLDYQKSAGDVANSPSGRIELKGKERVMCFDAATGKELWKYEYERPYKLSYPSGPRCTPTVADGKVYALGAEGDFTCLNVADGKLVWKKQLAEEYKVSAAIWGYTSHPLVDGDLVYTAVGGEGTGLVAFDKNTGKEIWRALSSEEPSYCPPTIIEHAGVRQLLMWLPKTLASVEPATGKLNWSVPLQPSYGMSISAPQQSGDYLFASGIGNIAALYKLAGAKTPEVVWKGNTKNAIYTANATPMIVGDMIYGCDCQLGDYRGVNLLDGSRAWSTFEPTAGGTRRASHGTAFTVKHNDRYFLFGETGDLVIANLSAKGYEEISRTHLIDPTNECFGRDVVWSHPAFAEKCVFVRNDKEIVCVSLAK